MADLAKKKSNQIQTSIDTADAFVTALENLREHVNKAKGQTFQNPTTGITDADFSNASIIGTNVHVDGTVYRQWITAATNLLAWWDDAGNANGNPDKKFLAMTNR